MEEKVDEILNDFVYVYDKKFNFKIKDKNLDNIINIIKNMNIINNFKISNKKKIIIRNYINNYINIKYNKQIFIKLYKIFLLFLIDDIINNK